MSRLRPEALALFATALGVRVVFPDASFFGPDQVGVLLEGRGVLHGHLFPPGPGIGWTPFKLGPLFEWVTALGLAPRDRFDDVLLLIAVIHAAAVVGWWRLFARIGGAPRWREVRIVGWALALHPLAISSGCAPISTSIVLPTTLIFAWGVVRWVQARDAGGFVLACVGAALVLQAHITATFVLPMVLVGFRWKAPIGRRGILGLVLGALVAAPMVIPNLGALKYGVFGHAGTAGAPLVVALFRALTLEGRVLETAAAATPTWSDPRYLACLVWSAFLVIGAITVARRREDAFGAALVLFGFVVPTLCVALIPRGALFIYFDSTVPFRAWLFANGVAAAAALRGTTPLAVGTSTVAHVAALLAMVVPAGVSVAHRGMVADAGYSHVSLSRMDLREPMGRPFAPVGILTLGSLQAIGRALDDLGADPERIRDTLHGPWRWAAADSVGIWIAEARDGRAAAPSAAPQAGGSFLLLHEDDRSAVPASAPVVVDRFRVYRFDDRLTVTAVADERIVGTLPAGGGDGVTLQVATDSTHGVLRASSPKGPLSGTATTSISGFQVWSSSPGDTEVTIELAPGERYVQQIRAPADPYAFAASVPPAGTAPRP